MFFHKYFVKHGLFNELQKIDIIYFEFDKADAMLPFKLSEME